MRYYSFVFFFMLQFPLQAMSHVVQPTENKLIYHIQYDPASSPLMHLSLQFNGNLKGQSTIKLPLEYGGAKDLYKTILNLKVDGAKRLPTSKPDEYTLTYLPKRKITIHYDVKQSWEGPLMRFKDQVNAPQLQRNYFRFHGGEILIYPLEIDTKKLGETELHWALPKKWVLTHGFGDNQFDQTLSAPFESILNGFYNGGEFRLHSVLVKGGVVTTAMIGKWKFDDAPFVDSVIKILQAERNFFDDHHFKHYCASLVSVGKGCPGFSGSGGDNSFAMSVGPDCPMNAKIWFLIAHENFHTWNRPTLFLDSSSVHDPDWYWFSEGFTNYYTNLLNLRAGLYRFEDYLSQFNEVLFRYYASPNKAATVQEIERGFWKDYTIEELPYQQGEILAHLWDLDIKRTSESRHSLDDLMKRWVQYVAKHKTTLTLKKMEELAAPYLQDRLRRDVKALHEGHVLHLVPGLLGPCVHQVTKRLAVYHPGFDSETSKKRGVVTHVEIQSQAYKAGIREGQRIVSMSALSKDIAKKMSVTIQQAKATKIIEYYPYLGELTPIPQFELDAAAWKRDPSVCTRWFG